MNNSPFGVGGVSPEAQDIINNLQNYANLGATQPASLEPVTPPGLANIQPLSPSDSAMEDKSGTFAQNFIKDAQEMGTGLVNLWVHRGEIPEAIGNYIKSNPSYLKDLGNAMLSPYNTSVEDFGNKPAREIIANVLMGIHEHPFQVGVDVASLGVGKLVGSLIKPIAKGTAVERGVSTIGSEVGREGTKLYDILSNAKKLAREKGVKIEDIIEAAETGKTVANQAEKDVLKEFRKFSDMYDNMAAKFSPNTYVGKEGTAVTQKILRDRMKINPEISYAQVEREITPLMDLIREGKYTDVQKMAKEGNALAKEVVGAKALYDKGRIFPLTHGLANVEKTGESIVRNAADIAGQFTRRAYGTSSYEDIAKQYIKPEEFLENTIDKHIDGAISQDLLRGTLGGQNILPDNPSRAVYLNRELLNQGNLKAAIQEIRKNRVYADDIAIDKDILNALKNQREPGGALSGYAKAFYNTGKSTLLAGGTYLGANAITGAVNALMNSNAFILSDILGAIGTKGKLAKDLGVFRRRLHQIDNVPVLKQIQKLNRSTGGALFGDVDRNIQNFLAEVGAHAELRKAGKFTNEAKEAAIRDMDRAKLGELINDVRRVALINSPNVPLPKAVQDIAFAVNPFWRWTVTAAQANLRMLEKNPLLANVALVDVAANIGFDREMQNRLKLGVTLDKPYTTYKIDDKTGQTKEITAEWVPLTTTIRMFDPQNSNFSPSVPVLTAITNALGGKDKYGRPLKLPDQDGVITRTVGAKTMQFVPGEGFRPVENNAGENVLNAAVKELIGGVNLWNRTVAPIASNFVSKDGAYYQPYSGSLFGTFNQTFEGNRMVGGDPNRPRTMQDVLNSFGGQYSSNYIPTREELGLPEFTPRDVRQFMRGVTRDVNRLR